MKKTENDVFYDIGNLSKRGNFIMSLKMLKLKIKLISMANVRDFDEFCQGKK